MCSREIFERVLLALCFLFLPATLSWAAESPEEGQAIAPAVDYQFSGDGPYRVATETSVWHDVSRGRSIPIKLIYPVQSTPTRCPVLVFSHGLGGTREGCAYLDQRWASHGFVSLHPQHAGSDESVWRGKLRPRHALKSSFEDPENLQARVDDLRFVLDRLEMHVKEETPLGKLVDIERIGVGGHAFGALAALVLAGQATFEQQGGAAFPDPRVKAVLALSSPISFDGRDYREVYGGIRVPILHMTGTEDDSPVALTRAIHRRIPFDNVYQADQFLVTFYGADHLTFSGHLRDRAARNDAVFQMRIEAASTAFWTAYLTNSPQLRSWLAEEGMQSLVGDTGRVEHKSPTSPSSHSAGL